MYVGSFIEVCPKSQLLADTCILELIFVLINLLLSINVFLFLIMFVSMIVLEINKDDFVYSQGIENLRHIIHN